MKKQGKRSKKKHLSREAFRKIRHKQNMWRVYKHTGNDKDYEAYKEVLNAATKEVRKSTRNFEHKLAQNIKSDSKAPLTPPRSALVCGISWHVPIGVSMRKRRSKKYKPTRVHKPWRKLNDFQDTG